LLIFSTHEVSLAAPVRTSEASAELKRLRRENGLALRP
jgi:hypothetical protein